jgi:hypothetical protein
MAAARLATVRSFYIAIAAALPLYFARGADRPTADAKTVYTLYRSSAVAGGEKARVHVATFDSDNGAEYNRDNCEIAKSLFHAQAGVTVTYWCERGFFSAS